MARPLFSARTKATFRGIVNGVVASNTATVQLARHTGQDRYGDTFADPEPHDAFVAFKQEAVRNARGEDVASRATVLVPFPAPLPAITTDDRLILPGESEPSPIVAVQRDTTDDPMIPTRVFL